MTMNSRTSSIECSRIEAWRVFQPTSKCLIFSIPSRPKTLKCEVSTFLHFCYNHRQLLELFKNQEIINWKELVATYEKEIRETDVFDKSPFGVKRWASLKSRVVEHVSAC
jgi:hypothetical protein